jgi:hypothetical protein
MTLRPTPSVRFNSYQEYESTYWTADTHLEKEDDLLPWCKGTQVYSGKSTDGDCADRVEERVNVADSVLPIGCIEDTRGYKRGECTARIEGQLTNRPTIEGLERIYAHKNRICRR